jgi:hyperosmotically inducible periplasmic protein
MPPKEARSSGNARGIKRREAIESRFRLTQRRKMKTYAMLFSLLTFSTIGALGGCSSASRMSPDVSSAIRKDLDQASFKDVTVTQDRTKGVVTLGGHVGSDGDKGQAATIAQNDAGSQVVAVEIAVIPSGVENQAKAVNADLDDGINKNLDAVLIQSDLRKNIEYKVKNGVVTLTGEVNSQTKRGRVEYVASRVPNVNQVVNELQVKNQKATSSN